MTVFILGQLCVPLTTNEGKLPLLMLEVSFSFWENYLFIPGPPRLWVTSHKKTPVANLTEKELIKTLQEGRGPGLACLQPRAEPESCGRMGSLNSPLRAPWSARCSKIRTDAWTTAGQAGPLLLHGTGSILSRARVYHWQPRPTDLLAAREVGKRTLRWGLKRRWMLQT